MWHQTHAQAGDVNPNRRRLKSAVTISANDGVAPWQSAGCDDGVWFLS
jgi:hypothetical protein